MSKSNQSAPVSTVTKSVSIDKITVCGFNPEPRVRKTALASLKKSIELYGIVDAIAVIFHNGKYHIANGHRRHALAIELGYEAMNVSVFDWPFERLHELWKILSTAKSINAQNWAESWFKTNGKMDLPSTVKNDVMNMVRIWGKDGAKKLVVDSCVSPNIVHCLRQVAVRLVEVPSAGTFSEKEIGDWLINRKMQNNVNALFSGGLRPPAKAMKKLGRCIKNGKPYDLFNRSKAA